MSRDIALSLGRSLLPEFVRDFSLAQYHGLEDCRAFPMCFCIDLTGVSPLYDVTVDNIVGG